MSVFFVWGHVLFWVLCRFNYLSVISQDVLSEQLKGKQKAIMGDIPDKGIFYNLINCN